MVFNNNELTLDSSKVAISKSKPLYPCWFILLPSLARVGVEWAEVVFNNKAMVYAGAGVCAVIGTLSPVCTALLSSCAGRPLTAPR